MRGLLFIIFSTWKRSFRKPCSHGDGGKLIHAWKCPFNVNRFLLIPLQSYAAPAQSIAVGIIHTQMAIELFKTVVPNLMDYVVQIVFDTYLTPHLSCNVRPGSLMVNAAAAINVGYSSNLSRISVPLQTLTDYPVPVYKASMFAYRGRSKTKRKLLNSVENNLEWRYDFSR